MDAGDDQRLPERLLTDVESRHNEIINLARRSCFHEPFYEPGTGVRCLKCGGLFILVLLPVLSQGRLRLEDDDDG